MAEHAKNQVGKKKAAKKTATKKKAVAKKPAKKTATKKKATTRRKPRTKAELLDQQEMAKRLGGPGRPFNELLESDLDEIEALAGDGLRIDDIAAITGIPSRTLERKCSEIIRKGRAKARATIGRTLFNVGIGRAKGCRRPDVKALIFYLKTQGHWSEGAGDDDESGVDGSKQSAADEIASKLDRMRENAERFNFAKDEGEGDTETKDNDQ